MSLHEVLRRRGYAFRQHLEEVGWTVRKPTVVDLSGEQQSALDERGSTGLQAVLERDGLWSFPATDITAPLPDHMRRSWKTLGLDPDRYGA